MVWQGVEQVLYLLIDYNANDILHTILCEGHEKTFYWSILNWLKLTQITIEHNNYLCVPVYKYIEWMNWRNSRGDDDDDVEIINPLSTQKPNCKCVPTQKDFNDLQLEQNRIRCDMWTRMILSSYCLVMCFYKLLQFKCMWSGYR